MITVQQALDYFPMGEARAQIVAQLITLARIQAAFNEIGKVSPIMQRELDPENAELFRDVRGLTEQLIASLTQSIESVAQEYGLVEASND